jgi:hypothetical protein
MGLVLQLPEVALHCPVVDLIYGAREGFESAGDMARSVLPTLREVMQSGTQALILVGNADWIYNLSGEFRERRR